MKAELRAVLPELEEMRKRKSDRKNHFIEVMKQIQKIKNEIYRLASTSLVVEESDLSLRKLEELHTELHTLQKEKVNNFSIAPSQLFFDPVLCLRLFPLFLAE